MARGWLAEVPRRLHGVCWTATLAAAAGLFCSRSRPTSPSRCGADGPGRPSRSSLSRACSWRSGRCGCSERRGGTSPGPSMAATCSGAAPRRIPPAGIRADRVGRRAPPARAARRAESDARGRRRSGRVVRAGVAARQPGRMARADHLGRPQQALEHRSNPVAELDVARPASSACRVGDGVTSTPSRPSRE